MRLFPLLLALLLSFPYLALTLPARGTHTLSNAPARRPNLDSVATAQENRHGARPDDSISQSSNALPAKRPSLDSVATALEKKRKKPRLELVSKGDIILGLFKDFNNAPGVPQGDLHPMIVLGSTQEWFWVVPFAPNKPKNPKRSKDKNLEPHRLQSFFSFEGYLAKYNRHQSWHRLQYFYSVTDPHEKLESLGPLDQNVLALEEEVVSFYRGRAGIRFTKNSYESGEIPGDLKSQINSNLFFKVPKDGKIDNLEPKPKKSDAGNVGWPRLPVHERLKQSLVTQ